MEVSYIKKLFATLRTKRKLYLQLTFELIEICRVDDYVDPITFTGGPTTYNERRLLLATINGEESLKSNTIESEVKKNAAGRPQGSKNKAKEAKGLSSFVFKIKIKFEYR